MFLTSEEIKELTGLQRYTAQARALAKMGIEYKVRPNGSIVVLRSHVEKQFGEQQSNEKIIEPKWSALDA